MREREPASGGARSLASLAAWRAPPPGPRARATESGKADGEQRPGVPAVRWRRLHKALRPIHPHRGCPVVVLSGARRRRWSRRGVVEERRMVRGRVELRRIEERGRRQVSFSKRRKGLLKKATELAVLCDAHVALLVSSPFDGKLHHFAAPSTMENIIGRYQNFSASQKNVHDKCLPEQVGRATPIYQSNSKGFDIPRARRYGRPNFAAMSIDESSIPELTVEQLGQIETKLEDALRRTTERKTQMMMGRDRFDRLQEKGNSLPEENFMDMTLLQEKGKVNCDETGNQHSIGEVDGLLRLSIGSHCNDGSSIARQHGLGNRLHTGQGQLLIDLNIS